MRRLSGGEQSTDREVEGGKEVRSSCLIISSDPCNAEQKFGEQGRGMSVGPN